METVAVHGPPRGLATTAVRALLAGCAAAALLLAPREARSQDAPPPRRMPWVFPTFRSWEWASTITVSVAAVAVEFGTDRIPDNHWRRGFFADGAVRNALVAKTPEGRERAATASDYLWPVVQYYPIVDAIITPIGTDRVNSEAAAQMTLLNWQAQSLAFLITRSTHRVVGRSRPLVQECDGTPSYDLLCNPRATGRAASFISGHTSMAFSGAGLACAHHTAMRMYGPRWADIGACLLALGVATTTGVLRIIADRHWTSDVVAGVAVGLGTGWLMPWALHYARWNLPARVAGKGAEVALAPGAVGSGVGLSGVGVF